MKKAKPHKRRVIARQFIYDRKDPAWARYAAEVEPARDRYLDETAAAWRRYDSARAAAWAHFKAAKGARDD